MSTMPIARFKHCITARDLIVTLRGMNKPDARVVISDALRNIVAVELTSYGLGANGEPYDLVYLMPGMLPTKEDK